MGTNSLKLLVALLLTAAFMVSAHTIPAIDPNVDMPTKAHELVARAAPERFPTNPAVATSAAAYTNCCQFKPDGDDSLKYTLNLAGWGNTNHKKNHTIFDDQNCADGLAREVYHLGEVIIDWMCVPSYGALRDTFVTFIILNPQPTIVIMALNNAVPGTEQWGCTNSTLITDDSWMCKPQQLNI
ncbi:hypothetical protein BCON_0104g00290 [Botryotinia convoluta]|uniref:Ecp2 effector protein domain-containing protein n=1 Tax=Botryotinia convoluta TaxID=54673 RepID=A0A4Z1I570_9HELO|nr:hypothetical protein BCON_0104g00290 [Botryotinia convoluta]